ncbi:VOC family protein [Bacillus seohaeanensis]|jgi:catechol 2,3-dioxygenase|uniref:VOC family protein n=1 Tax=Bacillus seohaeanensis TaxID=284580 RepID=A0ABW5RST6_9BACI
MEFHRPPHIYVGKVNIKVADLERSLTFYKDLIGFQILEQSGKRAILTANGRTPLLIIEQPDNVIPKQRRTTGLYHFALLLPNRSDLGAVLRHLLQNRYPIEGGSDHRVSEALYLSDPDGNGIEIYRDRPSTSWEWNNNEVVMTTEPLDAESLLNEGEDVKWEGLPNATLMGHIHLHVSQIANTEQFYQGGLGFDIVTRYGNQALFMSTGRYHHHIGLNTWNGIGAPTPVENSIGLGSFTLIFPDSMTRDKIIEQLQSIDAPVTKKASNYITKDPSGNTIELQVNE